jgi:hypothetical protein
LARAESEKFDQSFYAIFAFQLCFVVAIRKMFVDWTFSQLLVLTNDEPHNSVYPLQQHWTLRQQ